MVEGSFVSHPMKSEFWPYIGNSAFFPNTRYIRYPQITDIHSSEAYSVVDVVACSLYIQLFLAVFSSSCPLEYRIGTEVPKNQLLTSRS